MGELDKRIARVLPGPADVLLRFVTDDERGELERLAATLGRAEPPNEAPQLERAREIMRIAYRRTVMGHPGVE